MPFDINKPYGLPQPPDLNIIDNCPDHHLKTRNEIPGWWHKGDGLFECQQTFSHSPTSDVGFEAKLWHANGGYTGSTERPGFISTSKCSIYITHAFCVPIFQADTNEVTSMYGYEILAGPHGTMKKYLVPEYQTNTDQDRLSYLVVSVNKFRNHGFFFGERDAYRFQNELISSTINSLNERLFSNYVRMSQLIPDYARCKCPVPAEPHSAYAHDSYQ